MIEGDMARQDTSDTFYDDIQVRLAFMSTLFLP